MPSKLDQIRRLLGDGYVLEDIDSAGSAMEAMFRRGTRIVVVRFRPDEAEALLLAGPLRLG